MRKQKEYSTLKVQQEMLKAMFKTVASVGPNSILDVKDFSVFSDEECITWVTYKGIAIYRLENQAIEINRLPFLRIGDILNALNECNKKLELYIATVSADNKKDTLIILKDEKGNEHKIDKKFLDLVNLDPFTCQYYIPEVGKNGIVAVRDEDGFLLAGIMEVK